MRDREKEKQIARKVDSRMKARMKEKYRKYFGQIMSGERQIECEKEGEDEKALKKKKK